MEHQQNKQLVRVFQDMSIILSGLPVTDERVSFAPEAQKAECKHTDHSKPYSNCCGVELKGEQLDYDLCPSCHNHSEILVYCFDCLKEIPYSEV